MPFGDFKDFKDCVKQNQDKDSPEGYCAKIHKQITGEWPAEAKKSDIMAATSMMGPLAGSKRKNCGSTIAVRNITKADQIALEMQLSKYGDIEFDGNTFILTNVLPEKVNLIVKELKLKGLDVDTTPMNLDLNEVRNYRASKITREYASKNLGKKIKEMVAKKLDPNEILNSILNKDAEDTPDNRKIITELIDDITQNPNKYKNVSFLQVR